MDSLECARHCQAEKRRESRPLQGLAGTRNADHRRSPERNHRVQQKRQAAEGVGEKGGGLSKKFFSRQALKFSDPDPKTSAMAPLSGVVGRKTRSWLPAFGWALRPAISPDF